MTAAQPRPRRIYSGPFAEVLVVLPSGRHLTARRGEEVEVLPGEAEVLDSLDGWAPPTSKES